MNKFINKAIILGVLVFLPFVPATLSARGEHGGGGGGHNMGSHSMSGEHGDFHGDGDHHNWGGDHHDWDHNYGHGWGNGYYGGYGGWGGVNYAPYYYDSGYYDSGYISPYYNSYPDYQYWDQY